MGLGQKQKALEINLNPNIYGTFAETGAGQEVARHFFRAGGAAGTIAKSISLAGVCVSHESSIEGHLLIFALREFVIPCVCSFKENNL